MMSAERDFLFVYGTLRRGYQNPFAATLAAEATFVSEGTLRGRLFWLGSRDFVYPGATSEPETDSFVKGEIFSFATESSLLSVLDAYEGVGPVQTESPEYVRQRVSIETTSGSVSAWAYVYARPITPALVEIPSGDFALALPPDLWSAKYQHTS
jgi:gamma-glutamylcyclotransferase (GGCT)/AIG2-like uncharacterized protein YtfP